MGLNWVDFSHKGTHVEVTLAAPWTKLPPLKAAIFCVHHIARNYPPPYNLMVSGGIDSQAMIWAWYLSGIPFTLCSVRYNTDLNDHDLVELKAFCSQHNLPIQYIDFDLLEFLVTEYDDWAKKYECASPQICTYMKMSADLPGTVVFSGNYVTRNHVALNHTIMGLNRFARSRSVVPFFFMETPHIAFGFIDAEDSIDRNIHNYDAYAEKVAIYRKAGFPVLAQPEKFTGFERAKEHYDAHFENLVSASSRLLFASKPSRRAFDLLLRYPYEQLFDPPPYQFTIHA